MKILHPNFGIKRTFLTFNQPDPKISEIFNVENFKKDFFVSIHTDFNGEHEFLTQISLDDFARKISSHFSIVFNNLLSEDQKLEQLSDLWIEIDLKISAYLLGDFI